MNNRPIVDARYDAVVVGARVAGAATAMLLARAGLRVLAVERSAYGSDTLSTHALMRAGVIQLQRWGVLDRIVAAGTPAIRKTTFHYEAEAIEVDIKTRDGVDALYAPRRTVLDATLVDAARNVGAHIIHGARVTELLRDDTGRVIGVYVSDADGLSHRVQAGIVIGADGARSSVARAVGAEEVHKGHRPGAYIYGYWRGLNLKGTHWYYGDGVAAGAIPTDGGLTCVFIGMRPERFTSERTAGLGALYRNALTEVDEDFAAAIARAQQTSKLYPFAGRPGFLRRSWGPGWALVGDAACFKDPLTAHGMTDALRDAELLARAVKNGSEDALANYQAERDGFAVEFLDLSDEIASFDWNMERLKSLHSRLSKMMSRECDWVRRFNPTPAAAPRGTLPNPHSDPDLRTADRSGVPRAGACPLTWLGRAQADRLSAQNCLSHK